MSLSRRKLLGKLGAAAVAGAGINALAGSARAAQSMDMPMPPHRDGGTIYLDRNENAYGPSEQVVLAMRKSLARANRFPRNAAADLAGHIASFHKLKSQQIVAGCGSTDIFKSAVDAYLGPGKTLIISSPTFDVIGTQAAAAGANLKKSVLELGGSDAFIVLPDADLEQAASVGVASRFLNCGQSCIAAKRFILVESIAESFIELLKHKAHALRLGDPAREDTELGPMARADLRDQLHQQVADSVTTGATFALHGGPAAGPGFFYEPTVIDHVGPGMRAYEEELFGPVAIMIRARDEEAAIRIANDNRYGLGSSLWTRDVKKGERLARQLQSGASFVNGLVKSDPRLPFGGIKASGYGRELSVHGIREFVNIKTMWIR